MWVKLESVHLQKRPGARFNAYDALFSIKKLPDESLQALMTRVDTAMEQIQNLRPDSFTLEEMDKELVCMAMIRSLPGEYSSFASSLRRKSCRRRLLPKNYSGIAPTAWTPLQ